MMDRVELCFHSRFDCKGSIIDTNEIIHAADKIGTVGITDYATILGWPELIRKKNYQEKDAKIILGCEMPVKFGNGTHTVTYLVSNQKGKDTLYALITEGERNHKKRNIIHITDEMFLSEKYREGVLVGGDEEFICAFEEGAEDDVLESLAEDYDFLLLDVYDTNHIDGYKKMIEIGEKLGKPVVATCRPRYCREDDEEVYKVLKWIKKDEDNILKRCLLSTEEMLEKLSYVPKEKAVELVVTNSNRIAELCEEINLFDNVCRKPLLDNQNERLSKICYEEASKIYECSQNELPEEIWQRIEWELTAIKKTDMGFVFLLLRELMKKMNLKSNEISGRGTWENSFVAYLCGLSDFNPLDYNLSPYMAFGLYGDKDIDINLNFPNDRKEEADKLMETLEGLETAINAGVYGSISSRRAYNYVSRYEKEKGIVYSDAEREKIIRGIEASYHTRGVYPGGKIFIPKGVDYQDYFPMANVYGDISSSYYCYYELDNIFYKQDILGHEMTMLLNKMSLETGIHLASISLEDEKVMKLFIPDEYTGDFGCRGLCEFQVPQAENILRISKPKDFSGLVKVIALIHGTNVWKSNIEDLIGNGIIGLEEAPASRDDIFEYLIKMGMGEEISYKITEYVRKGKAALQNNEFWHDARIKMKEHGVPDWFIQACEKVQYMFPRAHAITYAKMVWREGYFKVYYPDIYRKVMEKQIF